MSSAARPGYAIGRSVEIEDRYRLEQGTVLATGVQAAVRIAFDTMRADRQAGRRTGAFVSGYRGSPLGGLDQELLRQKRLADELRVIHQPAVNEELGATAVWGSQLISTLPDPDVEGVLGVWYGKAPGLDRATDALRHGNFAGAHPRGGLVALCGDDPLCKSSSIPSASETTLAGLDIPVLYPGTPQEVLDYGLHAVAASRASGVWFALKLVSSVADGVASISVGTDRPPLVLPELEFDGVPYRHVPSGALVPPTSNELERSLYGVRLPLAREYARLNPVNEIVLDPPRARVGLVAAGAAYYDLREGLRALGLDDQQLRARGVRILKLGMIWPLEPEIVSRFAQGLEEVVVVEAKGPFIESQLRDALYASPDRPRVVGKRDPDGAPLISPSGDTDPQTVALAVGRRLVALAPEGELADRLAALASQRTPDPVPDMPARTPFFCSGCPHNSSTDTPDGYLVGAGIGCHSMITINPAGKGTITGITQMGGEGAQWLGQAPFVGANHLTQNMGDGTFSHSGSLVIRAAVAANANITFKLLYNQAVAMTGGQAVEGAMPVAELTTWLAAEGVSQIVVTTDEPERYHGVRLSKIASLRHRRELLAVQRELHDIPGVTVLIHDQGCAAELRRLRKRGRAPVRPARIVINERVCEGCGDCGQASHCLSVVPVDTEFGAKTLIHQASCNTDYSCLEGDCPSFLRVLPGTRPERLPVPPPPAIADPSLPALHGPWTIRLIGIGGTGVVTVSQTLAMAALLDGHGTTGLDQTGLAQKGGPVVSDVRIVPGGEGNRYANRTTGETVSAYLGFDVLGAADPANLRMADPGRTVAVVSTSESQTAAMIGNHSARFQNLNQAMAAIDAQSDAVRNVYLDAEALALTLFSDNLSANVIVLGAAWQSGLIPVTREALEEAIRLNGAAVEQNLAAFAWGRAVVADPDIVATLTPAPAKPQLADPRVQSIVRKAGADPGSELERLLAVRVPELIAYQGVRYARSYVNFVRHIRERERTLAPEEHRIGEAVARHLFTLMAYKDEYEVARLHLDPEQRARIRREFGDDAKVSYMLHPPLLRALGLKRKVALGQWFDPVFHALRTGRRLRGTPLDPFGYNEVRRVERALPSEYRQLVDEVIDQTAAAPEFVLEVCELPDLIKGYEHVKLAGVQRFRERAADCRERLSEGPRSRSAQSPR
jgi:indolepyruvate ferredoxin oxidoreductase